MRRLLRFFLRACLVGLRSVFEWMPHRLGLKLGSGLGTLAYLLLWRERQKAIYHLRRAFEGERSAEEKRRIALESFRNLGKTFYEVLTLDRLNRDDVDRLVKFEGGESLRAAAALGRGVIFVTGHIGNWELLGKAVAMRYPLAVVAAPIYDPRIEEIMIRLRARHGIETLVRDAPGSLRRLLAMLKRGGIVGILIDQDTKTDGVFVPFFNREAYTPTGAARLALRTGAAVVIGFMIREGEDRHRVAIEGPLPLHSSGNAEKDVWDHTARFTKILEDQIRRTPEQWVWMHERWRTSDLSVGAPHPEPPAAEPRTGSSPERSSS